MACTSSCLTQDHATWGECARSKNLQIADVGAHLFNTNQHRVMNDYVSARKAGLQPEGVTRKHVDDAWSKTEATGTPFRADK